MPSVTSGRAIPNEPWASSAAAPARTARNAPASSTCWSAGRTTMTASSGASSATVARAIAAAVFRPSGSSSTLTPGAWARTIGAWSWLVTTATPPSAISRTRSTVRWKSVRSPRSGRNGFGRAAVESGRRRVPPPPARITAYIVGFHLPGRRSRRLQARALIEPIDVFGRPSGSLAYQPHGGVDPVPEPMRVVPDGTDILEDELQGCAISSARFKRDLQVLGYGVGLPGIGRQECRVGLPREDEVLPDSLCTPFDVGPRAHRDLADVRDRPDEVDPLVENVAAAVVPEAEPRVPLDGVGDLELLEHCGRH